MEMRDKLLVPCRHLRAGYNCPRISTCTEGNVSDKKGVSQFEVDAVKRQKHYHINLWITLTRGARGKQKLFGEAFTKDTETPAINFLVPEGKTEEDIYQTFLALLVHRGFMPNSFRYRDSTDGVFSNWKPVSLAGIEGVDKVKENEAKNAV